MVWNTIDNKWECKDSSSTDIDGSQYLTTDSSGAYSGWVLYKTGESNWCKTDTNE